MSSAGNLGDDIKASVLAVGSVFVLGVVGYYLYNRGAINATSAKCLSAINTWVVLPLFALLKIGGFLNTSNIMIFVQVLISQFLSIILGYYIMELTNYILKTDIRARLPLNWIIAAGNVVVLPSLLVQSMCEPGGRLSTSKYCSEGPSYSSLCAILMNSIYFIILFP